MGTFDLLAGLPLRVEDVTLERNAEDVSSGFQRVTTTIRLAGGGHDGLGEDVTYDTEDHDHALAAGPPNGLLGDWTLRGFCDAVDALDLFPVEPERDVSRLYRRWAYHSAGLDLALRQLGRPLHAVLDRTPQPVTYVVSLRLGEPPSIDPLRRRLADYPTLRFKLDPTSSWTDELIAELVATGAVDSVDLKGLYHGSPVDQGADPDLYRRVAEAFPTAWIEDPALTPETDAVLEPHRDRITWDAAIHSVADIDALPFPPRMVNVKPSRLGGLPSLLHAYDTCAERGIGCYGGGQFELGPGRGQIQLLASLFHPHAPNDISPSGFHVADPPAGLPASPLAPAPSATGFRWDGDA